MPENNLKRFYISIVFPSILAIAFFIVSIFIVILPSVEKNIMEGKKEMISELTNTAWSLLEEYNQEVIKGYFSEDTAKELAAARIKQIRYGDEYKDYFWIIDLQPVMIMHPYITELVGHDLNNYEDPDGKLLFVEATEIVAENGEGFIDYMWQWKDDSTRIVPKLSYVKGFQPWGWIVGTGIYLEDVREEIKVLKNRLLRLVLLITLIISIILAFIIRQSLWIENRRKNAEKKLWLSRQKYKSLVDASTEGTLMILNEEIIFSNVKFSNLSGYDPFELRKKNFEDIFQMKWREMVALFDDPKKSVSLETTLNCRDGQKKEVVISASLISYSEQTGYIIIIKEISPHLQFEKDNEFLSQELQTALLLMNQPIQPLIKDLKKCPATTSIQEAALIMTRKERNVIFVSQGVEIIGVINNNDLKKRAIATGIDLKKSVLEIMTSPVITIQENALLYEVLLTLKNKNVSHLATVDSKKNFSGVIGFEDLIHVQLNTISFIIKELEVAEDVAQIAKIYKRLPVLVNSLIESGDKTENITRIITSVNDAVHKRIIYLAIEDIGQVPCKFSFMVMGSEGRKEQTLATDQDNAIIIEDIEDQQMEAAVNYFLGLGERVNKDLNTVGYHYCKGEIMAKNPKWTRSLTTWKKYFSGWINASNPQDILEAGIFFDFRCIYGEGTLVDELRDHVNQVSHNKSVFFYHMAQSSLKFRPPINIFGNIVGREEGADELNLDIKKVLFPITSFVRLYSIKEKLSETNSLERAGALYSRATIDKASYDELTQAYSVLTNLRLRAQVQSIHQNENPGNVINLNKLSRIEVTTLKKIFSEISELQTKIGFDFKGTE